MRLNKGENAPRRYFVKPYRKFLNVSAGVRDWILPLRHVFVEADANSNIVLIPTNDEAGYSATLSDNQMKICCGSALQKLVSLEYGQELACELNQSGKIICRTKAAPGTPPASGSGRRQQGRDLHRV